MLLWRTMSAGLAQNAEGGEGALPPAAAPLEAARPAASSVREARPEDFDIDRSPQYPPRSPPAVSVPGTGADGWPDVKPRPKQPASFWPRWFGKGEAKRAREPLPVWPEPELAGEPPAAPAAPVIRPEEEIPEAAIHERVERQAKEIEGLKCLDLASQAMSRGAYDEALKLLDKAMAVMPLRPYTVEIRNNARLAKAKCEFSLADAYYKQGQLVEATKHSRAALGYAPNDKDTLRLQERIDKAVASGEGGGRPGPARPPGLVKPPALRHEPEYLAKQKRIRTAIDNGRQYAAMEEYQKAEREFKSVLLEDEGNEDANAWLKKIAEEDYQRESLQYNRMKVEMMAQVRDTWTPAVKQIVIPKRRADAQGEVLDAGKQKMLAKLNSIVIPQLEFRQANIVDVIKYLDQQAIIADTASPPGEKGVNMVLQLKRPGAEGAAAPGAPAAAPAAPAEDALFPDGQAPGGATAAAANIPVITLTLRNIVLLEAIKYITGITGLKYRIDSHVVKITPANMVDEDVLSKTYKVQPNLGDLIRASAAEAAPAAEVNVELTATPRTTPGGDVKKFFVEAGVPFPEGTSIKYQPSLNMLFVANTEENHEKIDAILKQLNVLPMQVEIEARFVEIGQTDLEELGMEWLLTDNWEIAQESGASAALPLSARKRLQVNKNDFTKGLREFTSPDGSTASGGSLAGILSVSSILTNPELSFILHALEQRSGANLLSAPKVTTKSGANAEIKVVREIIYPTEFDVNSQNAGGTQTAVTTVVVTPAGFTTRDTGVILNVTPVVGPDGYTIDLTLIPQVVELADWINYGSYVSDPVTGRMMQYNMPQPVFHSRTIQTSISIWDGQTVVMGGLITETESTTDDKIPFLGDIPLLGFFFKNKTTKSIKRNLLIFVTANLVDPAGNKINIAPVSAVSVAAAPAAAD